MNENALVPHNSGEVVMSLTAKDVSRQVQLIQEVMTAVMKEGIHYGIIPGCGKKPSLFKSGAEKINLVFRHRAIMSDDNDLKIVNSPDGHREVFVKCHILNAHGEEMATGVGSCSTMESKYRYRQDSDYEDTGEAIPKDAKEKKREYRKDGFGMKSVDGQWLWVKYLKTEKVENPDIADTYNTVLKMGKKRAYVDGTITATGSSDFFTQDLEDLVKSEAQETTAEHAKPAPAHSAGPQRTSATEPTAEQLKALADKKRAGFHEPSTATGFITNVSEKNKGGYVNIEIEGFIRENGKPIKFSTKDEGLVGIILDRRDAGDKVSIEYTPNGNEAFASAIVKVLEVVQKGDAQE